MLFLIIIPTSANDKQRLSEIDRDRDHSLVDPRPISSTIGILRAQCRLGPGYGIATALTCSVVGTWSTTFGHITTMEFLAPKPVDFGILETDDARSRGVWRPLHDDDKDDDGDDGDDGDDYDDADGVAFLMADLWDATVKPPQPSADGVTKSAVNAAAARGGCWKGYTGKASVGCKEGQRMFSRARIIRSSR
ncbi:hypothetical protein TEQG_01175 [Trichophyton equinum CBS 127.97]|uniref:Uncharacterized protein n=1 Tax=Trichophyton equinum (strain ATCC MYA-4606 / CBS 127.97) TaxID=559882 RepID=F2PJR8_TRIEC|nr:hypothetical protein TEQG_01175 [Trichophyton equinum CBS 127.97]